MAKGTSHKKEVKKPKAPKNKDAKKK